MDIKREVIVTFTKDGFHRWAEAPFAVSYLANMHRHIFHVKVAMEVWRNDREVEFHTLLHRAKGAYTQNAEWSCEDIAQALAERLSEMYPERTLRVEVWEDGENGAAITLTWPQEGLSDYEMHQLSKMEAKK